MRRGTSFRAILFSIVIGGGIAGYLVQQSTARSPRRIPALAANAAIHTPLCGQADDRNIHVPPDWMSFVPPAAGQSYVDPIFGCRVKRLTNSALEETLPDGTHPSFVDYYSTFTPINADDTMLLIASTDGSWRIKNAAGGTIVSAAKMPAMNNGHPVWDASDPGVFYYTLGKDLRKARIDGMATETTAIHSFTEYRGIVSPDAADLSEDGDHIALVGQNQDATLDVFVWSLKRQAKTSVYTTACKINQWDVTQSPQPGCIHKLLLTADNLLVIAFAADGNGSEQGARLWNGEWLAHLQDRTNHIDTGYDLKGNPVFIESGNSSYTPGMSNVCPSGWGLDVRKLNDLSSSACLLDRQPGWHVSYRGSSLQPWAALSFFDDRKTSPERFTTSPDFRAPSADGWQLYEDEIVLASIDGTAIYRLAHARSRSVESYWATPRAAISRDGKYVVFTSNMAYPNGCPAKMHVTNECLDVYLIQVH